MKPSKHLKLGIPLKGLTGSKHALTVLNRYGHCVNYNCAEELETELTYSSMSKESEVLDGFNLRPDLATGVAWDNYDAFVETLDGKNILHDTVRICFQNIKSDTEREGGTSSVPVGDKQMRETTQKVRKRRSLVIENDDLQPYRKKLDEGSIHQDNE